MKLAILTVPSKFFGLGVDVDNYNYSDTVGQYLFNDYKRLQLFDLEFCGCGTATTSYLNWIIDFQANFGINSDLVSFFDNLDVRMTYKVAGYTDKTLSNFFVERVNQTNSLLTLSSDSYDIILYNNPPVDRVVYSGVNIQKNESGYGVYGNSQRNQFFTCLNVNNAGVTKEIETVIGKVKIKTSHGSITRSVAYGTIYSKDEMVQFLIDYGAWLTSRGMIFNQSENGAMVDWEQMVREFLLFDNTGWEDGAIIGLNPVNPKMVVSRNNLIIQPITTNGDSYLLNQDAVIMVGNDIAVYRDGTTIEIGAVNEGDTVAFAELNLANFEHVVIFDNITPFGDVLYDKITGTRITRFYYSGQKTADWNGTLSAGGFIIAQNDIPDYSENNTYVKGELVKYKGVYYARV
jgi:hypothetical protein